MTLLRASFASGVDGKDPRDRLRAARPGARVFTHLVVRNRSGRGRCVVVELRVNGRKRTTLTLKVGPSWSWRTWGYNTLRTDDRGIVQAIIRDDQGRELGRMELPIVPQK